MNPLPDNSHRRTVRHELMAARAGLDPGQRLRAEQRIVRTLAASSWLGTGRSLALYVSTGSEVSTVVLRSLCRQRGCRVYLPRIVDHASGRMVLSLDRGAPLRRNRYGIGEPPAGSVIDPCLLPLILLPLLGFDPLGTRLGTGAGYYDRLLAALPLARAARRCRLIGVAFDCQRRRHIEALPHDVPLDGVVTETGLHWFNIEPAT